MAFQTYSFTFAFLPLAAAAWYLAGRWWGGLAQRLCLLGACLCFYGLSAPLSLALLCGEGAMTYLLGRSLCRRPRRGLLAAGVVVLVGVLVFYKYTGFLLENLSALFSLPWALPAPALPLGLSFLTFQQLLFLRDCAAGELALPSPLDFALFLGFFPTVSSGPITRCGEMAEQLPGRAPLPFSWENLAAGLWCFTLGLAKKLLLADTFASAVTWGWANLEGLTTVTAGLTAAAYSFQLYFDFSGYCDMAAGAARMLGLRLPVNFDSPYRAVSVSDFWKRWHITLSRFFRYCVYIPLGGNRRGLAVTCRNILIVYLLSGLWHGAGWGFLVWGVLHGCAMCLERCLRGKVRLWPPLSWALTLIFITVAWIWFQAPTVGDGNAMAAALLRFQPVLPPAELSRQLTRPELAALLNLAASAAPALVEFLRRALPLLLYPLALGLIWLVPNPVRQMESFRPTPFKAALCGVFLAWAALCMGNVSTFLYVNF